MVSRQSRSLAKKKKEKERQTELSEFKQVIFFHTRMFGKNEHVEELHLAAVLMGDHC